MGVEIATVKAGNLLQCRRCAVMIRQSIFLVQGKTGVIQLLQNSKVAIPLQRDLSFSTLIQQYFGSSYPDSFVTSQTLLAIKHSKMYLNIRHICSAELKIMYKDKSSHNLLNY